MSESRSADPPEWVLLATGAVSFGEQRGLGISTIAFKVTTPNPSDVFILGTPSWPKVAQPVT